MPPQIIVQQQPPRKKSVGLFGGCLIIILALTIIGAVGVLVDDLNKINNGSSSGSPTIESTQPSPRDLKAEAMQQVTIEKWSWRKEGFGNVMEATFTIKNGSRFDIKDIEIRCEHAGKSGTRIDSNTRTIYDIIKAGETREFKDFNMGFIHSQAESSSAQIKDFTIIP